MKRLLVGLALATIPVMSTSSVMAAQIKNNQYYNDKGVVDKTFTGIYSNTWIEKGVISNKVTGTKTYKGKTYYVKNSKVIGEEVNVSDGWYKIKANNFYLDVMGADKNGKVTLYHHNGAINQKFKIVKNKDVYNILTFAKKNLGSFKIIKNGSNINFYNINTGKFLAHDAYKDGAVLVERDNFKGYTLEKTPAAGEIVTNLTGWYTIHPAVNKDYALDVNGNNYQNSTNVQTYKNNTSDAQKFFFLKQGDNYIIKTGASAGLSTLDSHGLNHNVHQWKNVNANQQKWKAIKNTDGTYSFLNVATHQYLDLYCGQAGGNVRVFEGNDAIAEKWILKPTSNPSNWTQTGWKGDRYFKNGTPLTSWQEMGNGTNNPDCGNKKHHSYFGEYGVIQRGWKWFTAKDGEKTDHWSYFGDNGWLRTGWFKEKGLRYADSKGWVYAKGYNTNKPTKPNFGVSGTMNGSYWFNDVGELVQVEYTNFNKLNQRAFFYSRERNYSDGCGPVACLMGANMMGQLKQYVGSLNKARNIEDRYNDSELFRKYMKTWQDVTNDKYVGILKHGTWNYENTAAMNKLGVKAEYVEDNNFYASTAKDVLTNGRVFVPLLRTKVSSGGGTIPHYVVVNGWRISNGKLQYKITDPYGVGIYDTASLNPTEKGFNDGWYDANVIDGKTATEAAAKNKAEKSNPRKNNNFTIIGNKLNI